MKKFIWQKTYNLLLILSNHFPSRKLTTWKLMVGTSLLILSASCSQPRQKNQPDDPAQKPTKPSAGNQPDVDILCYEPSIPDSIQSETEDKPSSVVSTILHDTPIEDDVMCYIVIVYPENDPEVELNREVLTMPTEEEDLIYTSAEKMPEFIQGDLQKYLKKQLIYPADAWEKRIEGEVVIQMVIEKDGSITQPKVVKGIYPSIDSTALSLVERLPNFSPALQHGEAVRVEYKMSIPFQADRKNKPKR